MPKCNERWTTGLKRLQQEHQCQDVLNPPQKGHSEEAVTTLSILTLKSLGSYVDLNFQLNQGRNMLMAARIQGCQPVSLRWIGIN